jgi:hypothetical protein
VVCAGHLDESEPQTCVACLGRVRRDLREVVELYALLPDQLGHATARPPDAGGSSSGGSAPLPGGDVLAMMAPGSDGAFWRDRDTTSRLERTPWRLPARLRHDPLVWSADPTRQAEQASGVTWESGSANPHRESDPPSVVHELATWEDDWRRQRDESAAGPASVVSAVGYLSRAAGWAADRHPAFDEFAADVARLRSRLEVATAMDSRPLVSGDVRCFQCQIPLRRDWSEEGLSDDWHCPRCRTAYDQASFWLAMRATLEAQRDAREAGS